MDLKPCPYRQVDDEGRIFCKKIKPGHPEVSPAMCRACPVAEIHCTHLRASLAYQVHPPITVRYGNGKTEIWDDLAPPIELERAACAIKMMPILSPRDCAGCPLHQELGIVDAIMPMEHRQLFNTTQSNKRTKGNRRVPRPRPAPIPQPAAAEAHTPIVAPKTIQTSFELHSRQSRNAACPHMVPDRVEAGQLTPRTIQFHVAPGDSVVDTNRGQSDSFMRIQNHRVRMRQTHCISIASRKKVGRY